MEQRYIYLVFSSTHNFIGKAIRKVTGETYNHISIALDEPLRQMYGFARRYYRTPLYGGFIRESHSRFCVNGKNAQIRICRLPVTQAQYDALERKLSEMHENRHRYIYNHISALGALIHRPIKAKDAYTCVEFGVEILHSIGIGVQPDRYYSVEDVLKILLPYCIYTGPMPQNGDYDTEFFAKHPVPFPLITTAREILKLVARLGKQKTAP